MPQVPYNPVPGEGSEGRGAGPTLSPAAYPVQIHASPDMFGASVGAAIEHLGGSLEKSGDEIFGRAQALLDLKNQADADEASVKFGKEVAQRHADFINYRGTDAAAHLQEYTDWLDQTRQQYAEGMSSVISRRMFDNDSRRVITQNINSAAIHAGDELKQANVAGINAQITNNISRAEAFPQDTKSFNEAVARNDVLNQSKGTTLGSLPEKVSADQYQTQADMRAAQIRGLARTDPFRAQALYDQYQGELGNRASETRNVVESAVRTVGARNITSRLFSGDPNLGNRQIDPKMGAERIGEIETGGVRGDRYSYVEPQASRRGFHALGKYGIMENELAGDLKAVGMPNMSRDAFLRSPEAQDELASKLFDHYQKTYGTANDAASMWIAGKRYKDARPDDPTDFPGGRGNNAISYVQLFNQGLAAHGGLRPIVNAARAQMAQLAPHDPLAPDIVEQAVETKWNQDQRIKNDDIFEASQTIANAFITPGTDGSLPTTVETLTANPDVKAAWEQLPSTKQLEWMTKLKHNGEEKYGLTVDALRTVDTLRGMARGDPDDIQAFLDTDVTRLKIPTSKMDELLKLQAQVKQRPEGDPRVGRALADATTQLEQVGITKQSDPDALNRIRGALENELNTMLAAGKTPTYKDHQEIVHNLISSEMVERAWYNPAKWVYGNARQMFFKSLTDGEKQAAKKDLVESKIYGDEPTEEQITDYAVAKKYQEKYGLPGKKSDNASKSPSARVNETFRGAAGRE